MSGAASGGTSTASSRMRSARRRLRRGGASRSCNRPGGLLGRVRHGGQERERRYGEVGVNMGKREVGVNLSGGTGGGAGDIRQSITYIDRWNSRWQTPQGVGGNKGCHARVRVRVKSTGAGGGRQHQILTPAGGICSDGA